MHVRIYATTARAASHACTSPPKRVRSQLAVVVETPKCCSAGAALVAATVFAGASAALHAAAERTMDAICGDASKMSSSGGDAALCRQAWKATAWVACSRADDGGAS